MKVKKYYAVTALISPPDWARYYAHIDNFVVALGETKDQLHFPTTLTAFNTLTGKPDSPRSATEPKAD